VSILQYISASRIFIRSITRSRIDNDAGAVDCRSFSMSVRLAMNVFHVA